MATTKKTTTAKTATPPNKPAPASPGTNAEGKGTGAAPAAPASNPPAEGTGQPPSVTTQETPPTGGKGKADKDIVAKSLIVSAKAENFRRSGRAWSKAETTVSIDEFTADQVEALLGEPMLNVLIVAE